MSDFIITRVENGVIPKGKGEQLRAILKQYEGKDVLITVERKYKKRSLLQNSYWRGVVVKMITVRLKELGAEMDGEGRLMDEDDVHYMLCTKFLKRKMVIPETGEFEDTFLQSRKLTTVQFMGLIEGTLKWAAEILSIYIPDPDPDWIENKKKK